MEGKIIKNGCLIFKKREGKMEKVEKYLKGEEELNDLQEKDNVGFYALTLIALMGKQRILHSFAYFIQISTGIKIVDYSLAHNPIDLDKLKDYIKARLQEATEKEIREFYITISNEMAIMMDKKCSTK